jgi:hypothetical protein
MARGGKLRRIVPSILFIAVLVTGAYALTATNDVDPSTAGSGAGTISGYSATAVHYNLDASDPREVDSFSYTISPSPGGASTFKTRLSNTAGTETTGWLDCSLAGTTVTCPGTGSLNFALTSADELAVVAAD